MILKKKKNKWNVEFGMKNKYFIRLYESKLFVSLKKWINEC